MEWIYLLIHSHEYAQHNFRLPERCQFFLDPYLVIRTKYKTSCALHPTKSGIPNLKLETVYRYVTGHDLVDVHNSLADCRAQSKILFDDRFKKYWDKADSILTVEHIWSKKTAKRLQMENEPVQPVHKSWKVDDDAEDWEVPDSLNYTSSGGGAKLGPSSAVAEVCRTGGLAELCTFFLNNEILNLIVTESNQYAHEEWVKPVPRRGGRSKYFRSCKKNTPGARHRYQPKQAHKNFKFSKGYVLSLLSIMMLHGARGSDRSPLINWEHEPYGWGVLYRGSATR